MFKNITKIAGLLFVSALLINCPKKKEDDNTALIGLLALSSAGATCEVTLLGTSIGGVPLTTATVGDSTGVGTRVIGSNTVAVVSAKGLVANKKILISGSNTTPTIFKQANCPLNTSQNVATVTTDYTLSTSGAVNEFQIVTPGDYLIFINATSLTGTLRAGVL